MENKDSLSEEKELLLLKIRHCNPWIYFSMMGTDCIIRFGGSVVVPVPEKPEKVDIWILSSNQNSCYRWLMPKLSSFEINRIKIIVYGDLGAPEIMYISKDIHRALADSHQLSKVNSRWNYLG